MENYLAAVSLVFLVAVLLLGFWKKVNMGFLAMGAALIIARLGGIPDKTVISNFSTSLFISLVGPAFLFSMAVDNGTIDLLARKILKLAGKKTWCIPLILAIVTFVLSALGCGNIPTFAIMLPMSIALALELGIDAIAMGIVITAACNFGCMSPIANGGLIFSGLLAETEYAGQFSWNVFGNCCIVFVLLTLAFYFIYKLYKPTNNSLELLDHLTTFNRNQKITMLTIAIVVLVVFVFGVNIGLAAPLAAVILVIIRAGDQKAAIKIMPWGTFMLVCGVNMLMAVVKTLGGIDLMVGGLTSVMSSATVKPIISLAAGAMSWFSSTTGVVMPALIPSITGVLEKFPNANFSALASGITITSFIAAISPASTGGAGVMAQYAVFNQDADEQDTNKLFIRLFLTSVVCVFISVILAFLGVYDIF
ncbi:MAG: SLC13 family permease [Lawsonibacter sp.]|nr:SLC13 family permease [Lawsonibacter sp.]